MRILLIAVVVVSLSACSHEEKKQFSREFQREHANASEAIERYRNGQSSRSTIPARLPRRTE